MEKVSEIYSEKESSICSICLEKVIESGDRSFAKLVCNHQFHLDCIGSAFNCKGIMQCPNCRHIEDGEWLYSVHTCFSEEFNIEEYVVDEDEYLVREEALDSPGEGTSSGEGDHDPEETDNSQHLLGPAGHCPHFYQNPYFLGEPSSNMARERPFQSTPRFPFASQVDSAGAYWGSSPAPLSSYGSHSNSQRPTFPFAGGQWAAGPNMPQTDMPGPFPGGLPFPCFGILGHNHSHMRPSAAHPPYTQVQWLDAPTERFHNMSLDSRPSGSEAASLRPLALPQSGRALDPRARDFVQQRPNRHAHASEGTYLWNGWQYVWTPPSRSPPESHGPASRGHVGPLMGYQLSHNGGEVGPSGVNIQEQRSSFTASSSRSQLSGSGVGLAAAEEVHGSLAAQSDGRNGVTRNAAL